jgi:hypothetical protein
LRLPNVDQARERQTLLDTLRQQRAATQTAPAAPVSPASQPPHPPADLQALIQQAVQQASASGTLPANGPAPSVPPPAPPSNSTTAATGETPVCPLHQVAMKQRSNARGSWSRHWLADEKRSCKGV